MSSLRKTLDFLASEFDELAGKNADLALHHLSEENQLLSEWSAGASVAWRTAAELVRDALVKS